MMKVLGLTGGIGSGKSTVAAIFKTLGVAVYNSDQRAKELYFAPEVKAKIEELLGKKAYRNEKTLDKNYIRLKIFADGDLLKKINAVLHPAVKKDFEAFKKEHKKDAYVIKESALLIEVNIAVDKLLLVTTTADLRKKRIAARDKISEKEIEQIVAKQLPDSEKIKKADWVIENSEEKLIIPQVLKIHQVLAG